ncbi:uncharacterized protein [Engystomops pustulosus]|uniref:uncharacterized protein n=1 Tax=Engystomops pustulosus TaxID=76066 RepID=UPI003AFAC569
MSNTETLLLAVDESGLVKVGLPPRNRLDNFYERSETVGKLDNVSRIAGSPEGELFCIRGGDLYKGPLPSDKDTDWFSAAQRVGKYDWDQIKCIFFHPAGELYAITHDGGFYKGPQPDNQHRPWRHDQAQRIGKRGWNEYLAVFFDPEGLLYVVNTQGKIYKGLPPTDEKATWIDTSTLIGPDDWSRFTYFVSYAPDGKLWLIDKYNGNLYRATIEEQGGTHPVIYAEYLGWNYNRFKCLSFTKDKIIQSIVSLEFLTDEGKKVSECPEVLEVKIYDNRKSSSTLKHSFMFQKTIKESSSFTHEHGFTFEIGFESTFKTGVPIIGEAETKVSMSTSTTHNWNFTKTNETEITFSSTTDVELEGGKAIKMVASVIKAEIDVPYKARARTMFGAEVEIRGMWKGVSHYHLTVNQEDYDK